MKVSKVEKKISDIIRRIEKDPHTELEFYGELAPIYDFLYGNSYNYSGQAEIVRDHSKDNARVLEVGCGTGRLTEELRERFPESEIIGLDLHSEMLDIAEKSFGDDDEIVFRSQDFFDVDTGSDFDVITGFGVNPHFSKDDHREFFRKAGEMLVEEGLLVFDYKDPEYEVNGRFNPWSRETENYRIDSRFTTVYDDGQSFYSVSYEFEDKKTGDSYTTGCLIEVFFHDRERLRSQLKKEGFEVMEIYTEDIDQSGVIVARKK